MNYYTQYTVYLFALVLPVIGGVMQFKKLDRSARYFLYVASISFFGELLGLVSVLLFHSNKEIYNVIGISNFVMLCLYFNSSVTLFKKFNVGGILAGTGILIWTVSIIFFDQLSKTNTPYMFYEGAATLFMTIALLDQLLSGKVLVDFDLRESPHFWFVILLFFYWCITICQWVLYDYFADFVENQSWINITLWCASILGSIGFFLIFLQYPKLRWKNATG